MDIIVNQNIIDIPKGALHEKSHGCALLNLLSCLGYTPEKPPLAELLRLNMGLDGHYVVVTPVNFETSHNDSMIIASADMLEIPDFILESLFQSLKNYLEQDNHELICVNNHTWLLNIQNLPALHAKPVGQLIHHSLMSQMSHLDKTHAWQKMLTEIQMLFKSYEDSLFQGLKTPINGVWFWGQGEIIKNEVRSLGIFEQHQNIAQHLCKHYGIIHQPEDIKQYNVVYINDIDSLDESYKKIIINDGTRYFYNNHAWVKSNESWIKSWWRGLFHAH